MAFVKSALVAVPSIICAAPSLAQTKSPLVRFGLLDISRWVAAMLVVLFHAAMFSGSKVLSGVFVFGIHGVDYFFVLSGFVIFSAHAQDLGQPRRLPNYLLRRFLRIFPPYWLAFAITLMVIPFTGTHKMTTAGQMMTTPGELIRDFFLIPNAVIDYPFVPTAWTLHYELLFYAAFCALILLWRPIGVTLFIAWGVAVATIWYLGIELPFPLSFLLNSCNLMFFVGIGAALIYRYVSAWLGGVIVVFGALWFLGYGPRLPDYLIYALPSGLIIAGLAAIEAKRGSVSSPTTEFIGNLCYSTYLIHVAAMAVAILGLRTFAKESPVVVFMLLIMIGAVSGPLFYVLLERPMMRMLRSFIRRPKPVEAPGSPVVSLPATVALRRRTN